MNHFTPSNHRDQEMLLVLWCCAISTASKQAMLVDGNRKVGNIVKSRLKSLDGLAGLEGMGFGITHALQWGFTAQR